MVGCDALPENAFGYVPTPALVAPIEFTMPRADYEALGGHMDPRGACRRVASLRPRTASAVAAAARQSLAAGSLQAMSAACRRRMLPDGRSLHLQDGPIDRDRWRRWSARPKLPARWIVAQLARSRRCWMNSAAELPLLRAANGPLPGGAGRLPHVARWPRAVFDCAFHHAHGGGRGRRRRGDCSTDADGRRAARPRAMSTMAATSPSVSAPGRTMTWASSIDPDNPSLFAKAHIDWTDAVRGIATSGWRGRSFSLGIADAVTVLAATASAADAAATLIANAVDLPGHPAITRVPADELQPDNDLGRRPVTRDVGPLTPAEISQALDRGAAVAQAMINASIIIACALHLGGETRTLGNVPMDHSRRLAANA
jgi:hypothetical protein